MTQNISDIQQNILSWYTKQGRKLPWRQTKDPYAIHISEVMLQQTQVERVVAYYHQWMQDFPDYQTLAKASKTDVLKHWSGLGFNSRAMRLQQCAQKIIENWKWKIENVLVFKNWKRSEVKSRKAGLEIRNSTDVHMLRAQLQTLPGIGPYTSAAIMSFARNLPVPVVDTNIRRVLIFLFKLPETISSKELEKFALQIIPPGKSRDWHNALMDQWALLLTARKTKIKPLSKQSKFEWSDRQVRWWTMKQIVKYGHISLQAVQEEFPHKKVKKIVNDLQQEGLIQLKKWKISIAK